MSSSKTRSLSYVHKKDSIIFYNIQEMYVTCNIDKNILFDIIKYTFSYYKLSVFGFNKKTDEFWAKKIVKDKNVLYFTINIKYYDCNFSYFILNPIVGKYDEYKNVLYEITENIELYKTSNFIKYCVKNV
jgi:hypothetical protein